MPEMPLLCYNCRRQPATTMFGSYDVCERCEEQAYLPPHLRD